MMTQTHLSAKGQVVIPKGLRDRLRWVPGMRFDIVERGGSVTLHPRVDAPAFAPSSLTALQALSPAAPAQPVAAISGLDDAILARLLTDD
jgi:AbrB family looped-hinge helix DNA binding protein